MPINKVAALCIALPSTMLFDSGRKVLNLQTTEIWRLSLKEIEGRLIYLSFTFILFTDLNRGFLRSIKTFGWTEVTGF